jgi:D-alanyl-D-alanine carboxypeptidase
VVPPPLAPSPGIAGHSEPGRRPDALQRHIGCLTHPVGRWRDTLQPVTEQTDPLIAGPAIQAELDRLVDGGLPGAFVYIEDGVGESAFRTAGMADRASGAPMTADTHYRIGSTTKTFTAIVVLQLIGEGRLALDDLVQTRLPDHTIPNADRLTLEHLLRMRSGLFDFEDDPSLLGNLEAHLEPIPLARMIEFALRGPTSFEPGRRFAYCNSNFILLEAIVERVTGTSLGEQMDDRIFEPAGLASTTYPAWDDLSLPEPFIHGYDRSADTWVDCSVETFGRGDGAIISTARDTARFFRALLVERSLLAPELLALMMSVVPDDPPAELTLLGVPTTIGYGLGLFSQPVSCGTIWGHSGGGFGYAHLPFVRLDTGRIAIAMRNASFGFRQLTNEALAGRLTFSAAFRSSLFC